MPGVSMLSLVYVWIPYTTTLKYRAPNHNPASATVRSPRVSDGRICSQNDRVMALHTNAAWEPGIGGQDLRANVCGYSKVSSLPASAIGATRPLALQTGLALALAVALAAASTAGAGWEAKTAFFPRLRLAFALSWPVVQSSSPVHPAQSSSVHWSSPVHSAHSWSVHCSSPVAQSSSVHPSPHAAQSSSVQAFSAGVSHAPPLLLLLLAAARPRPRPRPRPRDRPRPLPLEALTASAAEALALKLS